MKAKIKIFFWLFIIILLGILYLLCTKTLQGRMYWYGVKMYTGDLRLTDTYPERNGTNKIDWVVADSRDTKLFLGHVNAQDPKKYINDKTYVLTALYEPSKSPYPEVITNVIDCPLEFKPVKEDYGNGVVYKLFAGERFGYGICTKDLVKYVSLYGLFNCGTKGVFELKIFSQNNVPEAEKIMRSFRCN